MESRGRGGGVTVLRCYWIVILPFEKRCADWRSEGKGSRINGTETRPTSLS